MTHIYIRQKGHLFSYTGMTPVWRQANILNHRWDVDKGIFLDISVRPETK